MASTEEDQQEGVVMMQQEGDEDLQPAEDDQLHCVCAPHMYCSGARVAARNADLAREGISVVVCAARSLRRSCPDAATVLDVTDATTEQESAAYFRRMFECISAVRGAAAASASPLPPFRMCVALDDDGRQSLKAVAVPFARFVDALIAADAGVKLLCHCVQGKSRSVALICAWMMLRPDSSSSSSQSDGGGAVSEGRAAPPTMMLHEALDVVRQVRPIAQVNAAFGAQLFGIYRRALAEARVTETAQAE